MPATNNPNPYLGVGGTPSPKLSVTCHIDLLGYSGFIAATRRADYPARVAELKTVLGRAYAAAERASTGSKYQPQAGSAFKTFTDNVLIASPFNPRDNALAEIELFNMVELAASVQLSLLEDGFLSRGGIGAGWSYLDDRLGFGAGVVDAAKCDVVGGPPAVRLSQTAIELLRRHAGFYGQDGWWPQMEWLRCQADGTVVVNSFEWLFVDVRDGRVDMKRVRDVYARIQTGLADHAGKPSVLDKYRWAVSMFREAVQAAESTARQFGEQATAIAIKAVEPPPELWMCQFKPLDVARVSPQDPLSAELLAAFDP
jgi:hypothetical protein